MVKMNPDNLFYQGFILKSFPENSCFPEKYSSF
jgi:hypothetical protein